MKLQAAIERVREQYLDAETGKLVWVANQAAEDLLSNGEVIPLPEPEGVRGDRFEMPYTPRATVASLERTPPPFTGLRSVVLRKKSLLAGPYIIQIWEQG